MKNTYWLIFIFLYTITFGCHSEEEALINSSKLNFKKITLLEYKLGLNDEEQEYDLILLKLYEINPCLQVKAFDFTKSEAPLFKPATPIESILNSLIKSYPTDTKIPFPEIGPLYHGPDYLLVKEFESGELNVIDFSPFRLTKDLQEVVDFLKKEDYYLNSKWIGEPVNKVVLSHHFKMIMKQRIGMMGYPTLVSLDSIFHRTKIDTMPQ